MSTYTVSDQAITVARGRPGSLPMRWQGPNGTAINVDTFVFAAEFRWRGEPARSVSVAVNVAMVVNLTALEVN